MGAQDCISYPAVLTISPGRWSRSWKTRRRRVLCVRALDPIQSAAIQSTPIILHSVVSIRTQLTP